VITLSSTRGLQPDGARAAAETSRYTERSSARTYGVIAYLCPRGHSGVVRDVPRDMSDDPADQRAPAADT
jgi:hypothetical protein